jgi:hypothetical protein
MQPRFAGDFPKIDSEKIDSFLDSIDGMFPDEEAILQNDFQGTLREAFEGAL